MENNQLVAAIIESRLRVGDEVVMCMDKESRGWGAIGVADGTKGKVVGFYRYDNYVGRNDRAIYKPGVYEGNGVPIVQWDDGVTENVSAHNLYLNEALLIERDKDDAYKQKFEEMDFIGELPITTYIEGNVVRTIDGLFEIAMVDYRNLDFKYEDGSSDYPIYRVHRIDAHFYSTFLRESEILELVDKGNYWAWDNDKTQLKFRDLKHEAGFYTSLGFAKQMINPRTGNYKWELDEILTAIKEGVVDSISVSRVLFGCNPCPLAYAFPDLPELGARLRAETLKGFADLV